VDEEHANAGYKRLTVIIGGISEPRPEAASSHIDPRCCGSLSELENFIPCSCHTRLLNDQPG
jgi:hypothetical protein